MTEYEAPAAACPFYGGESEKYVRCDGYADGVKLKLEFPDRDSAEQFKWEFCRACPGYTKCRIYAMLEEIYENE